MDEDNIELMRCKMLQKCNPLCVIVCLACSLRNFCGESPVFRPPWRVQPGALWDKVTDSVWNIGIFFFKMPTVMLFLCVICVSLCVCLCASLGTLPLCERECVRLALLL